MQTNIKANSFKVWRTVELGTFKKRSDLLDALSKAKKDICVDGSDNDMLTRMSIAKERTRLSLVKIRPKDIGFVIPTTRYGQKIFNSSQLNRHALSVGLHLCPEEVAPQLCLQGPLHIRYPDFIHVGMKPKEIRWNDNDYGDGPGSNEIVWSVGINGLCPSLGGYHHDDEYWIYVKGN